MESSWLNFTKNETACFQKYSHTSNKKAHQYRSASKQTLYSKRQDTYKLLTEQTKAPRDTTRSKTFRNEPSNTHTAIHIKPKST